MHTEYDIYYIYETEFKHVLSENEANQCKGPITYDELDKAVTDMKLNKSPGIYGHTVEFCITFWNNTRSFLFNSFTERMKSKVLFRSQRQCIFSLLYKKGNPEDLETWHPISILNIDYKILAKVLAKRLESVLPLIINCDLQGYVKIRYIGINIRQSQVVIDYVECLNIDGAVLFVDFKKAFDTVE